jgi:glycogen debranching enzyme
MIEKTLSILDGNTFLVTDVRGDVTKSPDFPTGLFSFDTRFLSTWVLRVNGERLNPLSRSDLHFFETRFFLVPGEPTHYVNAKISVIREQSIGTRFVERLVVLNHDIEPADVSIRIDADADFADIFEIKENQPKRGKRSVSQHDGRLHLHYERATFRRDTVISSDRPAEVDDGGMTFRIRLEPHGRWDAELQVEPIINRGYGGSPNVWETYRRRSRPQVREELEQWIDGAPRLACDFEPLAAAYRRSLYDLAAMRYASLTAPSPIPTAGLPWFMTLFGRDSLFISLQTLPFAPTLTPPVLRLLGALQGTTFDDFREEEPGKILHEFRYGESAAFEEQPHTPYYGSADASPLFVILLDEYELWSGDVETVRRFEPQARAALDWIDEYGDLLGTGYIWKTSAGRTPGTRSPTGTAACPPCPGRPASYRGTPTTRRCAGRGWPASSGTTPSTPTAWSARRRNCGNGSTATSGSRKTGTTRSRSTPTASRLTHLPPTWGTCSGAALSSQSGHAGWRTTSLGRACSPGGAYAPWPPPTSGTTPSATTSVRSGRSTTRSSPGVCGATVSGRRPPGSPMA